MTRPGENYLSISEDADVVPIDGRLDELADLIEDGLLPNLRTEDVVEVKPEGLGLAGDGGGGAVGRIGGPGDVKGLVAV